MNNYYFHTMMIARIDTMLEKIKENEKQADVAIDEPKYKIGDVVVIGILQEVISYAQWNIKRKEWFYRIGKKNMFRESDIIYKLK